MLTWREAEKTKDAYQAAALNVRRSTRTIRRWLNGK